jgi:hypothetical protein
LALKLKSIRRNPFVPQEHKHRLPVEESIYDISGSVTVNGMNLMSRFRLPVLASEALQSFSIKHTILDGIRKRLAVPRYLPQDTIDKIIEFTFAPHPSEKQHAIFVRNFGNKRMSNPCRFKWLCGGAYAYPRGNFCQHQGSDRRE